MSREHMDYSRIENVVMPRSTFNRMPRRYGTTSQGYLTPFEVKEINPGDTSSLDLGATIRQIIPPKFPVMDKVVCDVFAFFVPNRLVWDDWKQFMGPENDSSAWVPETTLQMPMANINGATSTLGGDVVHMWTFAHTGSLWDKFGLPVLDDTTVTGDPDDGFEVNVLPFRGYKLIWNEFFRDQNLQAPVLVNKTGTASYGDLVADSDPGTGAGYTSHKHPLLRACKMHDYFTSCLPGTQKSAEPVSLFGDLLLPVITSNESHPVVAQQERGYVFSGSDMGVSVGDFVPVGVRAGTVASSGKSFSGDVIGNTSDKVAYGTGTAPGFIPTNLYATFNDSYQSASLPGVGALSVNDFRASFALQRLLERDARCGTRYTEMIRAHFGTFSPDARMQRPEYIGGMSFDLDVSQVTQQSSTSGSNYLGNVGAFSWTSARQDYMVHRNFVEHGYMFMLVCFRVKHTYSQGIHPMWTRKDRTDFLFPEFCHLGEQPVYGYQIYFDWSDNNSTDGNMSVFGFQEIYQEFRDDLDMVTGQLRPQLQNGLEGWTYSDYYVSRPFLSAPWIEEPSSNVARSLIAPESTSDQFVYDFTIRSRFTRVLSQSGIPGLIDHF